MKKFWYTVKEFKQTNVALSATFAKHQPFSSLQEYNQTILENQFKELFVAIFCNLPKIKRWLLCDLQRYFLEEYLRRKLDLIISPDRGGRSILKIHFEKWFNSKQNLENSFKNITIQKHIYQIESRIFHRIIHSKKLEENQSKLRNKAKIWLRPLYGSRTPEIGPTNDPWMILNEFETFGDVCFWRGQTKTRISIQKSIHFLKSRIFIQNKCSFFKQI